MTTDAVLDEGFDISFDADGDILVDDFFDTALKMSVLCERRASKSEVQESHRRRGWIGNEETPGFEIGSKVWIYEQARITRSTLNGIQSEAYNGLEWLVTDGYATKITTEATIEGGGVTLATAISRPGSKVDVRYFTLWNNTGIR